MYVTRLGGAGPVYIMHADTTNLMLSGRLKHSDSLTTIVQRGLDYGLRSIEVLVHALCIDMLLV